MAGKSDAFANSLMLLLYNNTDIANVGDAAGLQNSVGAGNFFVALHTDDPGPAGNQVTNEATYTGYGRQAVPRTVGGFTVSGRQVSNAAAVTYPVCGLTGNTITHFSIGLLITGTSVIVHSSSLGTVVQGPFTAIDAGDLITIPGHTLVVDERVAFFSAFGSALPTGITEGVIYWVKTVAGNDITVSLTQGGGTVNITAAGDGVAYEALALVVSTGITPSFAIGALVATEY